MDKLLFSAIIGLVAGVIDIPHIPWWLEGGVVGLALTIPMLIQVGHSDKKSLPIITFNAILLGTLVGLAGHYISVF